MEDIKDLFTWILETIKSDVGNTKDFFALIFLIFIAIIALPFLLAAKFFSWTNKWISIFVYSFIIRSKFKKGVIVLVDNKIIGKVDKIEKENWKHVFTIKDPYYIFRKYQIKNHYLIIDIKNNSILICPEVYTSLFYKN